ncbi:aminoethylphosphonate catabolism LysR family transcriptional regulator [Aquamicrobium terrae]
MKFEDLEAFLDVAELGGFSRAAAHRRVAQSALSRRVARLEHELGVQLLERRARGVQLTEHGIVLFERGRDLTRQLDVIEREVQELSGFAQGEVRLAIPPMTATVLAAAVIKDIRNQFPGIKLYIREGSSGQIHSWILSGEVDLALLYNPEDSAELDVTPVVKAPVFLVLPRHMPVALRARVEKGMTRDGRFRFKEIGAIPLIMPNPMHGVRKLVERMALEHRVSTDLVIEADGLGVVASLVEEGLGCTIFSYAGLNELVKENRLQLIPFSPPMSWVLAIVQQPSISPRRAVLKTRRILEKHIHALVSDGFWDEMTAKPAP